MRFAGHYADAESGWAYNRFRYYTPLLAPTTPNLHSDSPHD
ncbi:hypothetical protein [Corynebacterium jeikeium]